MPSKSRTNLSAKYLLQCSAAAFIALLTTHAGAQDALGDGRALDANPGQFGTSNSQRSSLVDELRFRNSIATGNAPGGLSFRGDLGYRAAGEFTGELGSDSLFAFRRDSLYSGLAGMGIRGTDALQYQFAMTTGSAPPRNLIGNLSYTRDDFYSSGSMLSGGSSQQRIPTLGINQQERDLDPMGQALSTNANITGFESGSMMGTLRSSSTYNTTSTMQPSLLSVYTQGIDRSPVGLIASPLLGITPTPLVDPRDKQVNPLVARPPNADTDPTVPGGLPTTRILTSYDALVQQMRERVESMRLEQEVGDTSMSIQPGETNDAWLMRQMDEIRRQLYGTPENNSTPQNQDGDNPVNPNDPTAQPGSESTEDESEQGSGTDPVVPVVENPDSPLTKQLAENAEKLNTLNKEFEFYNPTEIAIDPETLEMLRGNAANEIDQLLVPGLEPENLYGRHIVAGQQLIANARYFDAEERFTHALSIRPRDVVAQQGRLHAQIGAGMLLSASVNLQALYSERPELITTRYGEGVLPNASRVQTLKLRLSERAGIIEPEIRTRPIEGDRVRVSAGLLLAYLGYQSEDQDAIESGLRVVRELGSDSDRRFASLLGQLWIESKP